MNDVHYRFRVTEVKKTTEDDYFVKVRSEKKNVETEGTHFRRIYRRNTQFLESDAFLEIVGYQAMH